MTLWLKNCIFCDYFWVAMAHHAALGPLFIITMPKKKIAHLPLITYRIALCKENYKKSVTVRKISKNSLKLDQAECCNFFCFKMTTK